MMTYLDKERLIGWIGVVVGAILELFSLLTIHAHKTPRFLGTYYPYEAPLSAHEIAMIFLAVLSAAMIIGGIVLIYRANRFR